MRKISNLFFLPHEKMHEKISGRNNPRRNVLLAVFILAISVMLLTGCGKEKENENTEALTVFNYGDYMDMSTIKSFEKETGITVSYEQYVTPEDMYTKYQSGAIDYDLICTSDYIIEKMIKEGEVLAYDSDKMENIGQITQTSWDFCKTFDPNNEYAIPYFWGTVGILYNTTMVTEQIDSWSILWNKKYAHQIIMENSMRDAFLVPLKWRGYSLNTTDHGQLLEAQELLKEQKSFLEAYLVDESQDAMIAGDAAMAVIYSGDATSAIDANDDLEYVVPKEGSNVWFDCWFIPKSAKHKEAAEQFIDYMNRPDVAIKNFEYVYYGTPNQGVIDQLDEETKQDETIFPNAEALSRCEVYQYLGKEMDDYYNKLWKELKAY